MLCSINALANKATIHITIKDFSGSINVYNLQSNYSLTEKAEIALHLDNRKSTSYTLAIDKPTNLILYFLSDKFFNFSLFLSPGDDISLTADFTSKKNNILVTGKGSNNNQPEIFAFTNMDTRQFRNDETPYRVIAAINKQNLINKGILVKYIKVNKPSAAFIKNALTNLAYFVPVNYYEFSHNNNFGKSKQQLQKWKKIQDSVFSSIKLNNDDALTAYNYIHLIDQLMIREPEELWMEKKSDPISFYKEWFHSDTAQGKKFFNYAQAGILDQKIISKYFLGKVAEYAYSQSVKHEFSEVNYPSAVFLFDHFKKKYPMSLYVKGFSYSITKMVSMQNKGVNSKIIFLRNDGTNLNTFRDLLALTKGQTVFLDMWGTWCTPCRQEIEKIAPQLRAYFKKKNVIFLYVDNYDIDKEKEWKKQIAFLKIEGMHILANPKLTKDIMGEIKANSYPTYIIIKKDGSYKQVVSNPANIQALEKEISSASL